MNARSVSLPFAAVLLLTAAGALAEVSVDRPSAGGVVPFFESSESGPWTTVRTGLDPGDVLNAAGDGEGDGWPLVLLNEGNGRVEVLWSSGGEDRGLFRAFHDGTVWSEAANLSNQSGVNRLATAQADEVGNLFVAWERERNGRHAAFFTALSETDGQVVVVELTARSQRGRRPALVLHAGYAWVGTQEIGSTSEGAVQIAIDRVDVPRDPVGHCVDGGEDTIDIARQVVVDTHTGDSGANLGLQLHSEAGRLWMDWIDEPGVLGWAEWDGDAWSEARYEPFDPATGEASARERVRELVLGL